MCVCVYIYIYIYIYIYKILTSQHNEVVDFELFTGGTCGVMVIVVGNGHDDTSSNPGQD